MKQCPRCNQTYSDESLNFCLDDGERLSLFIRDTSFQRFADDSPPTLLLDQSRATNPTNWAASSPPAPWDPPHQGMQNMPFGAVGNIGSADQTLPTVALVLGIFSIVMICCYGGIWLGVPAAIVGFLGMRNADSDPRRYGGRGMAIGGMILGIISFLASMLFAIVAIIA